MTKKVLFMSKSILITSIIFSGFTAFAEDAQTEAHYEPASVSVRGASDLVRYSVKKDSSTYVSKNFRVSEFKSNDGADAVLIDKELVTILQNIRDHFGAAVTVNSAYRTAEYNEKVGGGKNSLHLQGRAADIKVTGVSPWEIAKYAETIGVRGIGVYSTFVHIDTRDTKYYWNSINGGSSQVSSFGGKFNSKPYNTVNAGVVTGLKVNTSGKTVNVTWNKSDNATSYDVYLITSPYGWNDVKYKKTVYSDSCSFTNVAKGSYYAFAVSRPNGDEMQSIWVPFKIN